MTNDFTQKVVIGSSNDQKWSLLKSGRPKVEDSRKWTAESESAKGTENRRS